MGSGVQMPDPDPWRLQGLLPEVRLLERRRRRDVEVRRSHRRSELPKGLRGMEEDGGRVVVRKDLERLTKEELIERVIRLEQVLNSLMEYAGILIEQRIEEAEDADED